MQQQQRREQALWRERHRLDSPQAAEIIRNGHALLNFCSNDYLGLCNHPELIRAAGNAAQAWGVGAGASHLVCGHQSSHDEFEHELAEFAGAEKALLFSSGYLANLAVPQSFLTRGDLLIEDKLNHASLLDAAQLSRAGFRRYRHTDADHARSLLTGHSARRKMISTDSVFSMDGNQAPLPALDQVAADESGVLYIDDAHGFGVMGIEGRGSLNSLGLVPSGHRLMMGTLGKAAGSFGAFIAGDAVYIDHLAQYARTYIYTTALPAALAESGRTALKLFQREGWRREKLAESIERFRTAMADFEFELLPSLTPIQPIVLGDDQTALRASQMLMDRGIWVAAIRPPTVPRGSARLRISLSAAHTEAHLNRLVGALRDIRAELNSTMTAYREPSA